MRLIHPFAAAALLAAPTIALAQATDAPSKPSASAAGAPAAATVTAGLPVMDKDGKPVGKVKRVETDASGNKVATITMGAEEFGVPASAMVVDKGAAKLNVTKSELTSRLKGR